VVLDAAGGERQDGAVVPAGEQAIAVPAGLADPVGASVHRPHARRSVPGKRKAKCGDGWVSGAIVRRGRSRGALEAAAVRELAACRSRAESGYDGTVS